MMCTRLREQARVKREGSRRGGCSKMKKKTPFEDFVKEEEEKAIKTIKMEDDLRQHGREVKGGYMMTVGDLQDYFRDVDKKKAKRKVKK